MKKKLLAGWLVSFFLFGMVGVANANLITNGSFESGAFVGNFQDTMTLGVGSTAITGWTVIDDLVAWIGPANPWSMTASNGNYFLDLAGYGAGAPFGGISQTILTVPGQSYVFSFDLGSSSSYGIPSAISASAGSTSMVFTSVLPGLNAWQNFSMPFTASTTNTIISLTGTTGVWYIGLDNVSVTTATAPIPEPGTLLLLGSGLVGLVLFRKKFTVKTA